MKNKEEELFGRTKAAEHFFPHRFETKQISLRHVFEPKVLIEPEAFKDMVAIAENSGSDEIGWLGTVSELGCGEYLIDGIYMPGQQVHGATCELTEDGLSELMTELASSNFDACERMHFWGHVHPGNGTSPSSQDDVQMDSFKHNEWFIRGIFGRNGRAEFTFFDFKNEIRWDDVPWQIYCQVDEARRAKWRTEVQDKVKQIPAQNSFYGGVGFSPFGQGSTRRTIPLTAGKSPEKISRVRKTGDKKNA